MGGTKPYRCALDRCGKGWKVSCHYYLTVISYSVANLTVHPTPDLSRRRTLVASVFRASMGCNTTSKCNPRHLMLIFHRTFLTLLPSDPRRTSVKLFSVSTHNSRSKNKNSPRTAHPLLETMLQETNVKSTLVRTMGAQISTVRKAAYGIICRT